ncbi:hypothetical protein C1H46_024021 [Malus baccata]|uniref:RanBP2-type domain-containing protein n=1 Tax=Malus baccata TaxID=106549 RepID=A0A540LV69_MALBA|nr:hypothetical protein C1H46_024021 [Malus baccata]
MATYTGKGAPSNGSVYVCNLPEGTDENMLAEHFGTIGLLKKDKRTGRPKIWLYRDKLTNEPKGDATVTYEDPHAASAAVEWFNDKQFHGNTIGVFIAESKSKDDQTQNTVVDPSFGDDFDGPEEAAQDTNGGGGGGRGRGDASGKAWQQEGDWTCPNTRGRGVDAGGRGGPVGAPTGGLFGPNDWPCPMCANINWAKRTKCNICNTNKPGHNEGGVRGGRGGGYKELDEEELEEIKRRRREAEQDDGEMYDEFGNLKKKFRAKTQPTETGRALPGAGRAGWEVLLTEMAEREIERGEGNAMIDRAARTETEMMVIGVAVEVEKGIGIGIGGEIDPETTIMIEKKNTGGRGIEIGTGTGTGTVIEGYGMVSKFWFSAELHLC